MSAAVSDRRALHAGIAIEWWSIGWMAAEAAVSLSAGAAAGSIALIAFGADSLIELVSAGTLLRRLRVEQAGGCAAEVQAAERKASGVVGILLFLLAIWVVGSVLQDVLTRARPEGSPAGLIIAAASTVVMPWIVATKRRIADRIGSPALRADAACGLVCATMAGTLLAGLALRAALGWWWADPLAALGIVYFIIREGREATAVARGRAEACGCR